MRRKITGRSCSVQFPSTETPTAGQRDQAADGKNEAGINKTIPQSSNHGNAEVIENTISKFKPNRQKVEDTLNSQDPKTFKQSATMSPDPYRVAPKTGCYLLESKATCKSHMGKTGLA